MASALRIALAVLVGGALLSACGATDFDGGDGPAHAARGGAGGDDAGADVKLDGQVVAGWSAIGASGEWVSAKPEVSGGTHTISSDGANGFGIQVYGVGAYTSYMYPGGLDLNAINPVVH